MDSLSLIQALKQELHVDVQIAYSLVLLKLSHVKQRSITTNKDILGKIDCPLLEQEWELPEIVKKEKPNSLSPLHPKSCKITVL